MDSRRRSRGQVFQSPVKQQIDDMLSADYLRLRSGRNEPNTILKCSIVHRTPLVKQYIEELEVQYNIPSPLKRQSEASSSNRSSHKIDVSLRNSIHHKKNTSNFADDKPQRKLTIVTNLQRDSNNVSH
jgi:hypothetical protein